MSRNEASALDEKYKSTLDGKYKSLREDLRAMGSVLVAFSAGVDSTLLLRVASDVLEDRALGVTGVSESLPEEEKNEAAELAEWMGARHRYVDTEEIHNAEYMQNNPRRCYFCRDELYTRLEEIAREEDAAFICEGSIVDDISDFRPGMLAIREHGVRSPLKDAGFTKADVRALSERLGLPTADKPSLACLSSRFPYGDPITIEALEQVGRAEAFIRGLGLRQFRVRHHKNMARLETEPADLGKVIEHHGEIAAYLKEIGYDYVTLDLEGYRTGSMNEVLKKRKAAPAATPGSAPAEAPPPATRKAPDTKGSTMSSFDPAAYGSVFAELLKTPRIMPLDPGEENSPAKVGLEALDLDAAFAPNRISDRMMAEGCRSGLWLYHDFLVTSHTLSQQITTPTGSYWHGIMHRREPDYPNGKYWFGRVGEHDIYPELRDEAATIASGTDNLPDEAAYLMSQSAWDPFAFIDLCEGANVGGVPAGDLCRGIQQREWELLFDYCYRKATA